MATGGLIGLLDDIAALAKLSAASLDDVSAAVAESLFARAIADHPDDWRHLPGL
ncbi:DUF808 family protein [Vreelandella venusta]|uniref:DUF808 family protein n=1 Tax=Vreelandella venusta TaxID=44935 RepID=UPI003AA80A00